LSTLGLPIYSFYSNRKSADTLYYQIIREIPSEKKDTIPFVAKKPKITSVSVEEIETESVESSGTELFNVLSSVGSTSSEKSLEKTDSINLVPEKEKDKEKKVEVKSESFATPFVGFETPKTKINQIEEPSFPQLEELPTDKDRLYQELIALEGKRYSLEKNYKELEASYATGIVDDIDYKLESDNLSQKLNDITSRINKIRRIISSL